MAIYLWPKPGGGSAILIRAAFGNGIAIDQKCCCVEPGGCCGRNVPGAESLEGPDYYPLVLHCRIKPGSGADACTHPHTPKEFDATWDPSILDWVAAGIDLDDTSTAKLIFTCGEPGWPASLEWGICTEGGGSITFDLTPTLTGGECDPVDLTGDSPKMVGLMCCGNLAGGTITVEVWE